MALSLGTPGADTPADAPALLAALARRPQPAVVWYAEPDHRVELSGAVLANWAHKLINLFREEYDLGPAQCVLIDMACHWKAAAAALGVYACGSEVRLHPGTDALPDVAVDLVITDRPHQWAPAGSPAAALRGADLAALSHGLLDASFEDSRTAVQGPGDGLGEGQGRGSDNGEGQGYGEGKAPRDSHKGPAAYTLPSWALDVSAEVRQQPDQVVEPLPAIPLPAPSADLPAATSESAVLSRWSTDSVSQLLQRWSAHQTVLLCDGDASESLQELIRGNEGLHR